MIEWQSSIAGAVVVCSRPGDPYSDALGYYPSGRRRVRFSVGRRNPIEGTSMNEKWRVSHVELLEGGLLFGFVLYDQKGQAMRFFRLRRRHES
jgi:hypothetical protein